MTVEKIDTFKKKTPPAPYQGRDVGREGGRVRGRVGRNPSEAG